ncbi:MAG: hypothetical protein ACREJM_05155 [Candidatus Saccharimonadales bacterium]
MGNQIVDQPMPARAIAWHVGHDRPPLRLGPRRLAHVGVHRRQVLPRLEAHDAAVDAAKMHGVVVGQRAQIRQLGLAQPPVFVRQQALAEQQLRGRR